MPRWFSFFKGDPGSTDGLASSGGNPYWVARVERDPGDPFARRRAGEELFRCGDHEGAIAHWLGAAAVSILMDGVVRILGRKDGRSSVDLGRLRPEDLFGLASVLASVPSGATLEAEIPGELLVWPRAAVQVLCDELPSLRGALES